MEKLTQMMVGKTVPTGRRRPHPIGEEEVQQVKGLSVQSRGGAAVQNVHLYPFAHGECRA